jgi:hypothetical protein
MPFSDQNCNADDIDQALKAHKERLGQIVLEAQPIIAELNGLTSTIEKDVLDPLDSIINTALASANVNSEDLARLGDFYDSQSKVDIEKSLTKLGLSVVNGRILVTNNGDIDLSAVKELHRLVGSFDKIKSLVPELGQCKPSESMAAGTNFKTKFALLVTYTKVEIIPGKGCKVDTQNVTEVLLGINIPLNTILTNHPSFTREDLNLYIFWFGNPEARPDLKDKALSLGLTDEEYFNAILNVTQENFKVSLISNPYQQICLASNFFGKDADDIITRGFSPNKRPKIKLYPNENDILSEVNSSGVMDKKPGRTNKNGVVDYSIPSLNLLNVADLEKSVDPNDSESTKNNACENTSFDLSQFYDQYLGSVDAISSAYQTLLNQIVGKATTFMNKVAEKFNTIPMFLKQSLKCYIPYVGLPFFIQSPYVASLLNYINIGLDYFNQYFNLLQKVLNILALINCLKASLSEILRPDVVSKIPGLSCVANISIADLCINYSLNVGTAFASLASQAISAAISASFQFLLSLQSLRLDIETIGDNNCATSEQVILLGKLAVRSTALKLGVPADRLTALGNPTGSF